MAIKKKTTTTKQKETTQEQIQTKQDTQQDSVNTGKFNKIYNQYIQLANEEGEFIPSGSLILDKVLTDGKGVPLGTFIEIASPHGCGKSTISLHVAREFCSRGKRVLYIDTESGLNHTQLESFNLLQFVEQGLFIPAKLHTFAEVEKLLMDVLEDPDLTLIFLDSITACVPQRILDRTIDECTEPGLHARSESLFLQKFKHLFRNKNKTLFFINQFRTQIGMGWGQVTKTTSAGGNAHKHYMDIALIMKKVKMLESTKKGETIPYGAINKISAEKNRYTTPFIQHDIAIVFGQGISNIMGIIEILTDHGYIKQRPRKTGFDVQFKNEIVHVGQDDLRSYIAENYEYYLDLSEELSRGE